MHMIILSTCVLFRCTMSMLGDLWRQERVSDGIKITNDCKSNLGLLQVRKEFLSAGPSL